MEKGPGRFFTSSLSRVEVCWKVCRKICREGWEPAREEKSRRESRDSLNIWKERT